MYKSHFLIHTSGRDMTCIRLLFLRIRRYCILFKQRLGETTSLPTDCRREACCAVVIVFLERQFSFKIKIVRVILCCAATKDQTIGMAEAALFKALLHKEMGKAHSER